MFKVISLIEMWCVSKEHNLIWSWKILPQGDNHCFWFLVIKICYFILLRNTLCSWFMTTFYHMSNNYLYFFSLLEHWILCSLGGREHRKERWSKNWSRMSFLYMKQTWQVYIFFSFFFFFCLVIYHALSQSDSIFSKWKCRT